MQHRDAASACRNPIGLPAPDDLGRQLGQLELTWVTVGAHFADTTWWNSQLTDAAGRFSLEFKATSPGEVVHEAKEQGTSGRLRLRATAVLHAYPVP